MLIAAALRLFPVLAHLALPVAAAGREDILIADFESEDYGAWKTTGEAFGPGPARGTLSGQMPVSGYQGERLVNSFYNGDRTTGTLTSPEFAIERKFLNFLIGGGNHPGKTCIDLLLGGETVRTAAGPNDSPGGSERLDWRSWDVAEFAGRRAVIRIVDDHTGGWGHINIDYIVLSDRKLEAAPAERRIAIEKRYLHLPVENGAAKRRMRFAVDGRTAREFEIELAGGEPDFWVFSDAREFKGRELSIAVNALPADSKALERIRQADEIPDADSIYREKLRPQFHFTSRRGWNNDPNGLVYYKGEYHLFYQHNPYGWSWGNMHWGHAVSTDLVRWKELPVAIYPHRFGDWAFSGCAVVDAANTAGFKTGAEDVIVIAYTSTGRGECIAYSNDRGRTFTEYAGNPVVRHQGRDPKVIWYRPGGHWVMAVYHEVEGKRTIAFYTSPDLKRWEYQSLIDGYFECPEIFELPVGGKSSKDDGERRWVVYAADGAYAIGRFDGKVFTPESGKHRFNYGNCFYASQTFSDIPESDGRRIQIAWGRMNMPGMPFNQMMNFPVELTLRPTEEGIRMFAHPVREIETLHRRGPSWKDLAVREGENPLAGFKAELLHIRARLRPEGARQLGLRVRGVEVLYDPAAKKLACAGQSATLAPENGRFVLEILADRASIEIFAGDGRVYMPVGIILKDEERGLAAFARGGEARIESLDAFELESAWGN